MFFFFGFIGFTASVLIVFWRRWDGVWNAKEGTSTQVPPYIYQLRRLSKNGPLRLRVGYKRRTRFRFSLRPEKSRDVFYKELGISQEFQTGDPTFDTACYILSDDPLLCSRLQASAAARQAVSRILHLPVKEIESSGRKIWIDFQPGQHDCDGSLATGKVLDALVALRDLCEELDQIQITWPDRFRDPFLWRAAVCVAIGAGFACTAVLGYFAYAASSQTVILDVGRYFGFALSLSAVFLLVFFGLVFVALRGSSRAHLVLLELLLTAGLGIPGTTCLAVLDLNRELDSSQPREISVPLQSKYTRVTRSRRSRRTHYYFVVPSWREAGSSERLEVSSSTYMRATEHRHIKITSRAGFFGFEWIESIRP